MNLLDKAIRHLMIANRILAHEGVVDAYGHVSVRHPQHPDRYLLSRSLSPELVEADDIKEYTLDGEPVVKDGHHPYLERFIHGAIYEAREDIHAVIHSHADDVLPFSITREPLFPVIHTASDIGAHIGVWDIRDRFGETNLLVTDVAQGRDLACCLGHDRTVLMRGHGFTTTGRSVLEAVKAAVYMPRNARILLEAKRLGGPLTPLFPGEIEMRSGVDPESPQMQRAWEYWSRRAGVPPQAEH